MRSSENCYPQGDCYPRKRRIVTQSVTHMLPTEAPDGRNSFRMMERERGFEPLTSWFVARRSIQLSYSRPEEVFLRILG